jgi:parvulin-like peptidyl-prolyl isomerase
MNVNPGASRRPAMLGATCIALAALCVPGQALAQDAENGLPATTAVARVPDNIINMVLVKVNGDPILLTELRSVLEDRMTLLRQQLPAEEIEAQMPALTTQILAGMVDQKMMLQRADLVGITIDANMVDRQIQNLREANGFSTDAQLNAALEQMGITMDQLREQLRDNLRQQRLAFDEVQRQIFVSETEINDYYVGNPDLFTAPEQVRLEQLVFIGEPSALRDQAFEAASEVQAGADASTVGGKYVNGQHVADTGSFIAIADLTEGLVVKVPALPVGAFSDPIETTFGYSIVKVVERSERNVAELDDAREAIRQRLTSDKSQARMNEYVRNLRDKASIEIVDSRFGGILALWEASEESDDAEATSRR